MNLLSGIAAAGKFVGKIASGATKKVTEFARREFEGELARVQDAVVLVRTAVSESSERARNAAADAIARGAAQAGIGVAARVGTPGNVYERAIALFGTPARRTAWLVAGGVVLALVLLYVVARRK